MTTIHGLRRPIPNGLTITPIAPKEVTAIVESVTTGTSLTGIDDGVLHAVAEYDHCYDVARRVDDTWTWASTIPDLSRTIGGPERAPRHQLHRVRIFGATSELIITCTPDAAVGRTLSADDTAGGPDWLHPRARVFLLADTPTATRRVVDGFTHISYTTGQTRTIPYPFAPDATPLGHTREFFTIDGNGAVTVAASTWTGYSDGRTQFEGTQR